jgi:hypothetical protein
MRALEIDICVDMIRSADSNVIEDSRLAKNLISETSERLRDEISKHVLKHNTAEKGIIAWIKPGVSRQLNPEPIHLKAALKYVLEFSEYESTGYHIGDIYSDDIETQYSKIKLFLDMSTDNKRSLPSHTKTFSCPSLERLKALYLPLCSKICYDQLVTTAKPITKTSLNVLEDLNAKLLKTHNSDGNIIFMYCN